MTTSGAAALSLPLVDRTSADDPANGQAELRALARCLAGDKDAYRVLVDRYKGQAYSIAYALLGDQDEALDAVQEAFVRAWRALGRFDPRYPFPTWFYRILRNYCLDQLRRRKHRRHESVEGRRDELGLETPDESRRPDRLAGQQELAGILRRAIETLRPVERDVVLLKDLQGMTYKEIAHTLHIPSGTVASTLFKARRKLQKILRNAGVRVAGDGS